MKPLRILLIALSLTACANTGVVEISPGTYLISKQDNAGIFGNFERFKMNVIQEANDFASSKDKVAIPVTMNETPAAPGRFATVQYQFRLVDADDPAAQNVTLTRQPDVIVESTNHTSADIIVRTSEPVDSDLYEELLKLDDLRTRGILNDTEFEAEKRKLLEQQDR